MTATAAMIAAAPMTVPRFRDAYDPAPEDPKPLARDLTAPPRTLPGFRLYAPAGSPALRSPRELADALRELAALIETYDELASLEGPAPALGQFSASFQAGRR